MSGELDLLERLSPNFELREFLVSDTAARAGIDMTPPPHVVAALRALAINVLDPVRKHFGRAVLISSGYRPPALNRLIGGSDTSQHTKGEASDFRVAGTSNLAVCRWMEANLNYDQLIYEYGEGGWIHASYRVPYRNQELSAVKRGGRTVYLPGLVA